MMWTYTDKDGKTHAGTRTQMDALKTGDIHLVFNEAVAAGKTDEQAQASALAFSQAHKVRWA